MTSELRPAVEVLEEAARHETYDAAVAVIEADREAVRAEIAAEVADYLKEGETIAECIARNRADANVLLEMFAAERVKVENYAKTMKIISDIANREAAELAQLRAELEAAREVIAEQLEIRQRNEAERAQTLGGNHEG